MKLLQDQLQDLKKSTKQKVEFAQDVKELISQAPFTSKDLNNKAEGETNPNLSDQIDDMEMKWMATESKLASTKMKMKAIWEIVNQKNDEPRV